MREPVGTRFQTGCGGAADIIVTAVHAPATVRIYQCSWICRNQTFSSESVHQCVRTFLLHLAGLIRAIATRIQVFFRLFQHALESVCRQPEPLRELL